MNDIFKAYDFENEQQWLKGRMNGIGGSDASAVVGMNPCGAGRYPSGCRWDCV